MAKTPVKQVTITLTLQTRSRERAIERAVRKDLKGFEVQRVEIEELINGNFRRIRLAQLSSQVDRLLAEIEGLVDDGLEELEGCYEAIEEFEEHTEQPEEYDDDTYT